MLIFALLPNPYINCPYLINTDSVPGHSLIGLYSQEVIGAGHNRESGEGLEGGQMCLGWISSPSLLFGSRRQADDCMQV
jgi:hypothetical protein